MQGRIDIDRETHDRWYGSGVAGFTGQVRALPGNVLLRPGADASYADGQDQTWMSVDWPSMTRELLVLGRRINVVDTGGDKPPLLLLHGLGGLWQNWLLNIPAFMGSHRVIAPDLPGFGGSEMPAGRISIQGFARVIDALCDMLEIENPVVVGNSMGGFIGAELALAFPTRVRKLVLVSAAGISVENIWREPVMAVGRLLAVGAARTGAKVLPVTRRPRLRRAALQVVVRYPEKLSVGLASELVAGSGTPGFVGGLDAVLGYSFRDRLPEIEVPTLIVWGRNDILIPVEDAHEFERLIGENAHAVIFDDTGHLSMLERPARFNELLAEFIAGSGKPEAGVEGVKS
jgi:pimeloyl-ACP methyl ester carboxylesterase